MDIFLDRKCFWSASCRSDLNLDFEMVELTNTQKKAVQAVGQNVCVSAGAGTGKTRVLVERFLYLIEQKLAKPHEILAITFTEKAAQEMKRRIAERLREQGLE